MRSKRSHVGIKALVLLVRAYQCVVSPWLRPSCRFQLTCSRYAIQVLGQYGVLKGLALTIKRLLRCGPWGTLSGDECEE